MHLEKLLNYLLEFQLLTRRLEDGTLLSITESHLLEVIYIRATCTAKDLSENTKLEKSTISRHLSNLAKRKLITIKVDPSDARTKNLCLSKKGIDLFNDDLLIRSKANELFLAYLPKDQAEKLMFYLKILADQLCGELVNSEVSAKLVNQHPLRKTQRRLSRFFGILLDDVLGLGTPSVSMHILLLLSRNRVESPVTFINNSIYTPELQSDLPYPLSTIQRHLRSLIQEKLVKAVRLSKTKDKLAYQITPQGREHLSRANASLYQHLSQNNLLNAYLLENQAVLQSIHNAVLAHENIKSFSLEKIKSEKDLSEARAFLVNSYIEQNKIQELPEKICASDDQHYFVKLGNRVVFLLSLISDKQGKKNIVVAHDSGFVSRLGCLVLAT